MIITHNRFYTEATDTFERPIRIPGTWVAYKNREIKEFKYETEALNFSKLVEFVEGESQELFMKRNKKWQDSVLNCYLDLLAKEYPNVSMEKIKEVTRTFFNDEEHLKVLNIVSDAVYESTEKTQKINNIDDLTAGDLVVVWEDSFYNGDNCPFYIRRFKSGNEETGEFDTWFMNTEDYDDFDSWKFCVKFEDFKQLLDENKI